MKLTIGMKLGLGFGAIIGSMIASSAITYFKVAQLRTIHSRVVDVSYPTAQTIDQLLESVSRSFTILKDCLTSIHSPEEEQLHTQERAAAWIEINEELVNLERLSGGWSSAVGLKYLYSLKSELTLLRAEQDNLVRSIQSDGNDSNLCSMLQDEAAPMVAKGVSAVAAIIEMEAPLEATPERKLLLKDLAVAQGSLWASLTELQAYCQSNGSMPQQAYQNAWDQNTESYEAIRSQVSLLTVAQRPQWEMYAKLRQQFAGLASELLRLGAEEVCDVSGLDLDAVVEPRVMKIASILSGMRKAHLRVVARNREELEAVAQSMTRAHLAATAVAAAIAALVAMLFSRRLVRAIQKIAARAKSIAAGDLSSDPLNPGSADELGELTIAVNEMSVSLRGRVQEITQRTAQLEDEVAQREQAEAELLHIAHHDKLTGLADRAVFHDHLTAAIRRAGTDDRYIFAVMFMDLDRFKLINDGLGHDVGDGLLVSVADRIRTTLDELSPASASNGEGYTAARFGGDEMVMMLECEKAEDAEAAAHRILEALSEPHPIEGREVTVTASIGVVLSTSGYELPGDMIRDADQALYQAKSHGRARCVVFDRQMHNVSVERLNLESALRNALQRDQIKVFYEPIVHLETGLLLGFEVVSRWELPWRGWAPKDQFVTIAQETGMIVPINAWVLRRACAQFHAWQQEHLTDQPLTISINVHKRQLLQPGFAGEIEAVCREEQVDPSCLVLELTESAIDASSERIDLGLEQLRELGVKLSLDRFGSGPSSLSCLYTTPLDVLKLDRDLVQAMEQYKGYTALAQAILTLAHNLDCGVIAAGVQSAEQLAMLQALECDMAQGPYVSEPVDAQAARAMIERGTFPLSQPLSSGLG